MVAGHLAQLYFDAAHAGFLFANAAAGFSRVEVTIDLMRAGKVGPRVVEQAAAESDDMVDDALRAISVGTFPRWRLVELRIGYRVAEREVLEQFQHQLFDGERRPAAGP